MANDELTDTSLRTGRLMAATFPTVGFIVNISSLAVLWIGADRISDGQMQVGSLVAYLSYLIQILIAVVMATFMVSMIPRAAVAADRIVEVLDTDSSVAPARAPGHRGRPSTARSSSATSASATPVPSSRCCATSRSGSTPARPRRSSAATGAGKTTLVNLVARLFDATEGAVLVDGVDVRELDPDLLWGKVGYVPQKAFLFSGTVASNLRFGRPDATDAELWEALEIAQASGFVQAMPDGLDSDDRAGRHQRVGRPAPAAVDRPGARRPARDLRVRRLVLGARPRHRRPPAGGARTAHPGRRGADRRPTGVDDRRRRPDPRARGRTDRRARAPTTSWSRRCPTYAEIVESQLGEGAVA